jgi:hypothetical protein
MYEFNLDESDEWTYELAFGPLAKAPGWMEQLFFFLYIPDPCISIKPPNVQYSNTRQGMFTRGRRDV